MMRKKKAPLKRLGGRPTLAKAETIKDAIISIAAGLFLRDGYGAVSIEAVAKAAGISKRTFYARFKDKAELFAAVVHHLTQAMQTSEHRDLFEGKDLQSVLQQIAKAVLKAAMSPNALALHRLLLAEASRFPELAEVMSTSHVRQDAIDRIAKLLDYEIQRGTITLKNTGFAAEQFLQLVISSPQRRALGMGSPMSAAECNAWAENSVELFMNGCVVRPIVV